MKRQGRGSDFVSREMVATRHGRVVDDTATLLRPDLGR